MEVNVLRPFYAYSNCSDQLQIEASSFTVQIETWIFEVSIVVIISSKKESCPKFTLYIRSEVFLFLYFLFQLLK